MRVGATEGGNGGSDGCGEGGGAMEVGRAVAVMAAGREVMGEAEMAMAKQWRGRCAKAAV